MQKELAKKEFKIVLSQEILNKPYSLEFAGVVEYFEHKANPNAKDSDIDYYGYNEFDGLSWKYIFKVQNEEEQEILLCDITNDDFGKFAEKLNIQFGF